MKIFLLNGPPRCGKDSLKNYMTGRYSGFVSESLASPLKLANKAIYGLSEQEFHFYDNDNEAKDAPQDVFFGKSWRQVNIDLAEKFLKKEYGKDVFAKMMLSRLKRNTTHEAAIVSDLGFDEEYQLLANAFGAENVFVIKIKREGCDFSKDSRNYINVTTEDKSEEWLENVQLDQYLVEGEKLILKLLLDQEII